MGNHTYIFNNISMVYLSITVHYFDQSHHMQVTESIFWGTGYYIILSLFIDITFWAEIYLQYNSMVSFTILHRVVTWTKHSCHPKFALNFALFKEIANQDYDNDMQCLLVFYFNYHYLQCICCLYIKLKIDKMTFFPQNTLGKLQNLWVRGGGIYRKSLYLSRMTFFTQTILYVSLYFS